MAEEKSGKVWKCRHCLFIKKDRLHGNMTVCFFGGVEVLANPSKEACDVFTPSRRAKTLDRYMERVDAGLVGNRAKKRTKIPTADELESLLEKHLKRPVVNEPKHVWPDEPKVNVLAKAVPKEERTSAFKEQMCAGRCCKRKEICKHYESWLEHGRPKDAMRMIVSVSGCIESVNKRNGMKINYSRFLPLDGYSEDDVKEYQTAW